jgi:hypothetical protein
VEHALLSDRTIKDPTRAGRLTGDDAMHIQEVKGDGLNRLG